MSWILGFAPYSNSFEATLAIPAETLEEEFLGLKLETKCKGVAFSEGVVIFTEALLSIRKSAENSSSEKIGNKFCIKHYINLNIFKICKKGVQELSKQSILTK